MHGLTQAEMEQMEQEADREEDGLTPLEARFIANAARASNVAALRLIERTLHAQGCSRSMAAYRVAQLRKAGAVPEPEDADTLAAFQRFLKDLTK